MMGYWNGYMMNSSGGEIFLLVFWILSFIDLVLLGIWLWQQIVKSEERESKQSIRI